MTSPRKTFLQHLEDATQRRATELVRAIVETDIPLPNPGMQHYTDDMALLDELSLARALSEYAHDWACTIVARANGPHTISERTLAAYSGLPYEKVWKVRKGGPKLVRKHLIRPDLHRTLPCPHHTDPGFCQGCTCSHSGGDKHPTPTGSDPSPVTS